MNVEEVCNKYNIENWSIVDGKVNVNGDVDLTFKYLTSLDIFDGIPFGAISGSFYCEYNQLTSLEGAPTHVGENFYCFRNKISSLKYGPSNVGGDYFCSNNQLTSLESDITNVGGNFNCINNQLTSLKYAPKIVGGNLYCNNNDILDFKYFPNVGGILNLNTQLRHIYDNYIKTKDNIQLFNEFDIIRGNKLNLNRLSKFVKQYGGNELNTNKLEELGYELS